MKHWTPEEITVWHTRTFPEATAASQLLKLEEELEEWESAGSKERQLEATADVIIVCTALTYRWNSRIAGIIADAFGTTPEICEKISAFVDAKMESNTHRRWKIIPDGRYIEQPQK